MQIKVKEVQQEKAKFHPFVIELKIESEQDLIDLRCRFNLQAYQVNNSVISRYKCDGDGYEVWYEVDKLLKDRPYMK